MKQIIKKQKGGGGMISRNIKIKENELVPACPKCGNRTEFVVKSQQVMEDGCEIWAECKCGYDATEGDWKSRIEDVWGGVGDNNSLDAIDITWVYILNEKKSLNTETHKENQ